MSLLHIDENVIKCVLVKSHFCVLQGEKMSILSASKEIKAQTNSVKF